MAGEWESITLAELSSEVSYGYTESASSERVGPRFLRITDIQNGVVNWENVPYCPITTDNHKKYKLQDGDIVVARTGNSTGENFLYQGGEDAVFASYLIRFRINPKKADPKYVWYNLRSRDWWDFINNSKTGSAQAGANAKVLGAFSLKNPPLPEQRAIAHILGTLDDKIELNRRRNQTLEAMARALFKDWFVDFGPVRAKMEGREPYLPADLWQLFPDRLDDEGKPEGWGMQPLSELFVIIGGGTPKTSVAEYWGGDIPWFSVVDTPAASDVFVISTEKSITEQGLAGSSARLIPKGTTIISARGTVGNLAIAGRDMTFNQSCYGLRGTKGVGDYFVYLTAQKMVDQLKSMAHGSVFSTITRQTFEAIQRPVPPPAVLEAFERMVTEWFETILSSVEESRTLAQIRDTLLPKLVSGELRIADAKRFLEKLS